MTDGHQAQEGWNSSAQAWIKLVDAEDVNRTLLLDRPMLAEAGDVAGHLVLDLGCGEGRFCRMLADRGANVIGLDPTLDLLTEAKARDSRTSFCAASGECLPFTSNTFDLVVCYLVLIDIPDYAAAIAEMGRVLKPGGKLLIANLQSFATTRERAWYQDEKGQKLHVAVEEYFTERPNRLAWGGVSILNWHRPMQSYMQALISTGLVLESFIEPRPLQEDVIKHPRMEDEFKVPIFHVMRWAKPK